MSQSAVFSFNPCHCGFTDEMISIVNQAGVNLVAIGDVQETFPSLYHLPEPPKRLQRAVADNKLENAR